MRKFAMCISAVFCLMGFVGCAKGVSLSERAIVKAVFVDCSRQNYEVGMVILTQSEESEQSQKASVQWGTGKTVAQAVHQAEEAGTQKMFYGQNQLLFVGQQAAEKSLNDVLSYFSAEKASRPNMAVYTTEMNKSGFEQWTKEKTFPENLQGIEKGLEKFDKNARMIYELEFGENGVQGLVPLLRIEEKKPETTQMALYQNSTKTAILKEESAQIARLLLGMQKDLQFSQEYDGETIYFSVDNPHIAHTVFRRKDGKICLQILLKGSVRSISAENANEQAQLSLWKNRTKLSQVLSEAVSQKLQDTILPIWSNGQDPFGFSWWFAQWNSAEYCRLQQSGAFFESTAIETKAEIQVM